MLRLQLITCHTNELVSLSREGLTLMVSEEGQYAIVATRTEMHTVT